MNLKKLLIFIVFCALIMGICVSCVDAKSFSCKSSKVKSVGKDNIHILVCKKADSADGISVRATCVPKNSYDNGPAHHKLDKITVKYKVGKKTYKKTKKLGYVNDYHIPMPKNYKIIKITVNYHKASNKEYKKLKANCWWT